MIIHHAMLVRRLLTLDAESGAQLFLGKAAYQQLVCEPELFDVIEFATDSIFINTAYVVIDPDGGKYVALQQWTRGEKVTWRGTLQ